MAAEMIRIEGSAAGVAAAARAFDAFSERHHLPGAVVQAAQVALDEVLSNVVKAGFEPGALRSVEVSLEIKDGALEMGVSYNGLEFDPLARHDPDTLTGLDDRPVGGLGIYLVKKLMDAASYDRIGGTNRLHMTKRIPA